MYLNKLLILKKLQQANTHLGQLSGSKSDYILTHRHRAQTYIFGSRAPFAGGPERRLIFNLDKTIISLRRACNVIKLIFRSNGHFLLINTNPKYNKIIQQTAIYTNQSYINHKWIGGFLTNWKNHMQNVQQQFQLATKFANVANTQSLLKTRSNKEQKHHLLLENIQPDFEEAGEVVKLRGAKRFKEGPTLRAFKGCSTAADGQLVHHLGKSTIERISVDHPLQILDSLEGLYDRDQEQAISTLHDQRIRAGTPLLYRRKNYQVFLQTSVPRYKKMQKCFEGTLSTKWHTVPDCVIILNANQNSTAIYEAYLSQIPIISIVDSTIPNELYRLITYPIPANYDSVQFIYLFCNCILKTILGSKTMIKNKKKNFKLCDTSLS
jgi:ribosomal protein S2